MGFWPDPRPPKPSPPRRWDTLADFGYTNWRDAAKAAALDWRYLNANEASFVRDLSTTRFQTLTPKQHAWLISIMQNLRKRGAWFG